VKDTLRAWKQTKTMRGFEREKQLIAISRNLALARFCGVE